MNWVQLPNPPQVPGMILWGAIEWPFQYVVSYDFKYKVWAASARRFPNYGPTIELGDEYKTQKEAKHACRLHSVSNR